MKKILTILFPAIAIVAIIGCSNDQKPESVATDFLKAYFETDYSKAASYCTPSLGEELVKAVEELENLSPEVKELMKRHTANYQPEITSVEEPKGKDTVIVSYSIINRPQADSTATGGTVVIEKQLSLVKSGEGWSVAALNNNR